MSDGTEESTETVETVETPEVEAPEAQQDEQTEESSEDHADDLQEKKRRGKTAQDRINDLTRARREAERERDYYKGLVNPNTTPVSPASGADKPTSDQFDTYDEYIDALTDWKVSKADEARTSAAIQHFEQTSRQAAWSEKVEAASHTIPDYQDVVGSSEIPIASHVADALMDSDKGPELAYHMARNPEFADRLNRMSPLKAALELGRLETTLTASPVRSASRAPAPANPIRPSTTLASDPAKMSMDEYVKWRAQRKG